MMQWKDKRARPPPHREPPRRGGPPSRQHEPPPSQDPHLSGMVELHEMSLQEMRGGRGAPPPDPRNPFLQAGPAPRPLATDMSAEALELEAAAGTLAQYNRQSGHGCLDA